MNKKEKAIEEIIDSLNKLVEDYQKALDVSNNLINMKNRFIELCEEETAIYKKQNQTLNMVVFVLSTLLTISLVALICLP